MKYAVNSSLCYSKIVVIGSEKGGIPILIQPESGVSKP
jgi:hypothetical protein